VTIRSIKILLWYTLCICCVILLSHGLLVDVCILLQKTEFLYALLLNIQFIPLLPALSHRYFCVIYICCLGSWCCNHGEPKRKTSRTIVRSGHLSFSDYNSRGSRAQEGCVSRNAD
jgi:hypothetical protein